MRILVTRPEEDAKGLLSAAQALGHEVELAPLMNIELIEAAQASLPAAKPQAIAITSANGLRAYARREKQRDLPVYAVGAASAEAARAAGFERVYSADGALPDLVALIERKVDPHGGFVLHPAASDRAGDLAGQLRQSGFEVIRAVLYRAAPVNELPPVAARCLSEPGNLVVSLFSPRTAKIFSELVAAAGLNGELKRHRALCLSEAVAGELDRSSWSRLVVAQEPNQMSLLEALSMLESNEEIDDPEEGKVSS